MPPHHVINGRFGSQRLSGVQRVATRLLQALDGVEKLPGRWQLLSPTGVAWPPLRQVECVRRGALLGRGHAWEQAVVAAAAASGARVLNIAGSGPWFGGPQVSWLHDAAVFDHPEGYRPAFVHWYRALFRRRARRGDLLIAPSHHARARLALHLGVPEPRIAVISHGGDHLDGIIADPGVLGRLGLVEGRFWLCVASRNPNKNLPRLLRAHARARGGGELPLVLLGADHPRVFAQGAGLPAAAGVQALAEATDAELKALLLSARALLVPSLVEGFGLPALEAMRLGCAVLCARAGSLPEVCGDAACYVDPLSEGDMAAALDRLTSDDALVRRLRASGLLRAAPSTWARAASSLLRLLEQGAPA